MNDKKLYFRFKIDILSALKDHGITYHNCRENGVFSQGTLTHLRKGENISLNTACKICAILGVQLSDVFEVISEVQDTNS